MTTTGGALNSSVQGFEHHGVRVAAEGDYATCPACKAGGPVMNDAYPSFTLMDGRQILVRGARVMCHCPQKPLVIPSQSNFTIEVNRTGLLKTSTLPSNAVSVPTSAQSLTDGKNAWTERTDSVEVIVSDSRVISAGSQWGHVAIYIDGTVYSRAHEEYVTMDKGTYFNGGTVNLTTGPIKTSGNLWRNNVGLVLKVSPEEKHKIRTELERRVKVDREFRRKHPGESEYSVFDNSCSSNVADVLELVGIMAHDPRWLPTPVTPAELEKVLAKSRRLARKNYYPKQAGR